MSRGTAIIVALAGTLVAALAAGAAALHPSGQDVVNAVFLIMAIPLL